MTYRTVLILLVMAVFSIGAAIYGIGSRTNVQTTNFEGERLFPGLLEEAKTVTEVHVTQAGDTMIFDLKGDQWTLRNSGGYPVHTNLVTKVILSIASMELLEAKTALEKRHNILDLGDPMKPGTNSQYVVFKNAAGDVLSDIVVGNANFFLPETTTGGMYVRHLDEAQTYLVRGLVDIGQLPRNWLQRDIIDIPTEQVARVEVTQPDGEQLFVVPNEEVSGGYEFENLPEGMKLTSGFAPRNIAALVNGFVLNDVRRNEDTPLDESEAYVANFMMNSGMTLNMQIWRIAEKQYMRMAAAPGTAAPNSDGAKLAEEITARTGGWTYIIPEYQYEQISKKMADVTAPIEGS